MKTQFNISRQRKKYKLMRNDREIKEKKKLLKNSHCGILFSTHLILLKRF